MDKPLSKSALAERIDAVDFDVNRPWHDAGQPPLVFSYKFETAAADDFPWTGRVSGLSAWSAVKQDTIRDVLAEYATVINLEFVERPAFTDPDFSFYLAFNGVAGGLARFDYSGDDWDGSAAFNASRALDLSDRWIVLHEIGHTLGLKHTGDYDAAGFTPPPPFLPADEDNGRYSVMSYNNDDATFGVIDSLGVYDIAALQARFGANMRHNTGNDRYGDPGAGNFQTIWDAGGRDTLFARDALAPVDLDLRGGTRSDFATGGAVVIAYGAQIENAVGGAAADVLTGNAGANRMTGKGGDDRLIGGRGADRLLGESGADTLLGGNGADWLKGGTGDDTLIGGRGKDRFIDGAGSDMVKGGGGFDVFVLRGAQAKYDVTQENADTWLVTRGADTDTLIDIEMIRFADDALIF